MGSPSLRRVASILRAFGVDPVQSVNALRGLPRYARDLVRYRTHGTDAFPLDLRTLEPVMTEFRASAGTAHGHYFFQDLWAAKLIYGSKPHRHVDIGSRIDGFVAHLLVFMPVEVVDIRPLADTVDGLSFVQEDATHLSRFATNSLPSVSCLHAAEHFGLGRYGDTVDPQAAEKVMRALARVIAPGGRLYFSVPVGRERLAFNAQRIFSPETVLRAFADLKLVSFSYVDDAGNLQQGREPSEASRLEYGCGLFEFSKRADRDQPS